jgi:Rad3-related DNA helicase
VKNAFLALSSPFNVEHRLVYYWPILTWPKPQEDQTVIAPDIKRAIDRILALHPNSRGLIHSVSYPRSELLIRVCQSPRLISHTNDKESFTEALALAAATPRSILVSPRATEGVDLKGELSEFQVFIKIPFQKTKDPRVEKRRKTDRDWYTLTAIIAIVQGSGRSVRTFNDVAPTYVLDTNWSWWFRANSHLFPEYFRQAVRPMLPSRVSER